MTTMMMDSLEDVEDNRDWIHVFLGNRRSPDPVKIHGGGALGWVLDWPFKSVSWMTEAIIMRKAEYDFDPNNDPGRKDSQFWDEWLQRKENGATSDLLMMITNITAIFGITTGFTTQRIAKEIWESPRYALIIHAIFSTMDGLMHNYKMFCAKNPVWLKDGDNYNRNPEVYGSALNDLRASFYAIKNNEYFNTEKYLS